MVELTVTLYSHHFSVTKITARARTAVTNFARRYIHYKLKKRRGRSGFDEIPDCVYAVSTSDRSQYRFHINQLPDFKDHLRICELNDNLVEYVETPLFEPRKVELTVQPHWKPDPTRKQPEAIAFLEAPKPPRKLLGMPTGYGKSYSTMQAVANLNVLSAWVVKAGFMEKTRLDMLKTYELEVEDIMEISTTKDLKLLILMAQAGPIDCKIVLMSSKLLQIWISLYERMGYGIEGIGYGCMPFDFYPLLGVGIRVIDEVHLEFHFNFKHDLYTHVPISFSLSATLKFDNAFVNSMAQLAYPLTDRFEVDYVPYVSATYITYEFEKPDKIRVLGKQGMYSHHVFEESVMKDKKVLAGYVNMIDLVVKKELLQDHVKGERMVIYASGVEFCTLLVEELQKRHPHLAVRRYCGSANDPYEDLMTADLCVTTLGSAGTNVDIPDLKCVLLTPAVDSSQSNIQGFGRLRNNLANGRVSRFVWLVCEQIGRHVVYHEKKVGLLRTRAKTLNSQYYGVAL